ASSLTWLLSVSIWIVCFDGYVDLDFVDFWCRAAIGLTGGRSGFSPLHCGANWPIGYWFVLIQHWSTSTVCLLLLFFRVSWIFARTRLCVTSLCWCSCC